MGQLVKSEKSADKQFQFSVFSNPWGFSISIKKFKRSSDGKLDFHNFNEMNLTVSEFENFKSWIKTIKKRK